MERTSEQIRSDYDNAWPLGHDDKQRYSDQCVGKIGDGQFGDSFKIGEYEVGHATRLEMLATDHGIEPVLHVGWANFFENSVLVKNANMPINAFFSLAEAVVQRDEMMGVEAAHSIMQYEAPDIIDKDRVKTFVGQVRHGLEYGLLESKIWDQASEGREVAILNPSIPTLKRVIEMKGERRVYFTELGPSGTEYFQEIIKVMAENHYNRPPTRIPLNSLPTEYAYYLGFTGGKDNSSRLMSRCMFGFELNPYHPDALNGMLSGIMYTKKGLKMEIARGSYTRQEYYEETPTYFRYYGDVIVPHLKDKDRRKGGEEAYNFICSREIMLPQRCDTLLNEGDVLCDGFFFKDSIARRLEINGLTCYIDTSGSIVDIEKSCSYENRRIIMEGANLGLPLARPIHDSRRARIAYLRYRSSVCDIHYVRPNEVTKENWVDVALERENIQYGLMKFNRFVQTKRADATMVWSKKYGYRTLDDGNYPCDETEYVQLLDHSMLRAVVVERGTTGVEAIIRDGYTSYNCVSRHSGVWRTLQFCRLDVDYKSNFNLVQVFKSYSKFIGPFIKHSLIIAKGKIKRKEIEIDKESFDLDDGEEYLDLNDEVPVY